MALRSVPLNPNSWSCSHPISIFKKVGCLVLIRTEPDSNLCSGGRGRIRRPRPKQVLDSLGDRGGGFVWRPVEPLHVELVAKPGELAFGKLAGALFDERDGVRKRSFSAQMFEHLPITNRLQRGGAEVQFALEQLFGFVDQAAL